MDANKYQQPNHTEYERWSWSDYTWLPSASTWADVESGRCDARFIAADCRPILVDSLYATAFVLLLRMSLHCLIALPIAGVVGVYRPQAAGGKRVTGIAGLIRVGTIEYVTGKICTKSKTFKFLESAWKWTFWATAT